MLTRLPGLVPENPAPLADLLRTGTGDKCVDGIQQAYAWWEEYPEVIPSIIFSYLQVSPGDSIEASVYRNTTGQWVTRVDDLTMGSPAG